MTRPRRDEQGAQAAELDRRLARVLRDRRGEALHVVPQRGVVDAHGRCNVGAEHARIEPAIAAERPEAVALAPGGLDRGRPVDREAELPRRQLPRAVAGREDDGRRGDGGRAALELYPRLPRRHPGDVDARDRHARGQAGRGAGEREPEHRDRKHSEGDGCGHAATRRKAEEAGAAADSEGRRRLGAHYWQHASGRVRGRPGRFQAFRRYCATTWRWISEVPSTIWKTFASRIHFSTGWSRITPAPPRI